MGASGRGRVEDWSVGQKGRCDALGCAAQRALVSIGKAKERLFVSASERWVVSYTAAKVVHLYVETDGRRGIDELLLMRTPP